MTVHDRALLDRQMEATETRIDHVLYELYGLTGEETGVVESSFDPHARDNDAPPDREPE